MAQKFDVNEQNQQALGKTIAASLSSDVKSRKAAETELNNVKHRPGFPIVLLKLVTEEKTPAEIRLAGAIFFKNLVKSFWAPPPEEEKDKEISAGDRDVVRQYLIQLMLTAPRTIQLQLAEAMAVISKSDFPAKWPQLLPDLVGRLKTKDYKVIVPVLETIESITRRYRYEAGDKELLAQYKYVLDNFCPTLLPLYEQTVGMIKACQNPAELKILFQAMVLLAKIIFILNFQTIPEFFEDNMLAFFNPLIEFLKAKFPALDSKSPDEPGLVDQLHACICEIADIYLKKYEDELGEKKLIEPFVYGIWNLLISLTDAGKHDEVATNAIKFLTSVVSNERHKNIFNNNAIMKQICEKVIIPQLKLREADIEMFSNEGLEYIRRDIEGSDIETRRHTTVEFVRGLCKFFEREITELLKTYIGSLLQEYASDKKNKWVSKDAALFIVLSLSIKGATAARGATQINPYIDVGNFFATQVLPELQDAKVNDLSILKADCLKFVSTFRSQLPATSYNMLLPLIVKFLKSEEFVVHTYAAVALEKLLGVKDKGVARLDKQAITPHLENMLTSLFATLSMEESKENSYVMKAILRVCSLAKEAIAPFASVLIQKSTGILGEVAKNPKQPQFNHYVFETLSCLVLYICQANKGPAIDAFEKALFPPFQAILNMDSCVEFHPYVFQILAQLLEFRSDLSKPYQGLFQPCLMPALWENQGNVPALTRLMQAYCRRGPQLVAEKLPPLLGVFQRLVSLKKLDNFGMSILGSIVEFLPLTGFGKYLQEIMNILFTRLQSKRTPKFVNLMSVFVSLFVAVHGFNPLVEAANKLQQNLLAVVLEKVLLPNVKDLQGSERKQAAVGFTHLICKQPGYLADPYIKIWPATLDAIINIVELPEENTVFEEEDGVDAKHEGGAAYARLRFSDLKEHDPFASVKDVKVFLAQSLGQVTAANPGKFAPLLNQLPPKSRECLNKYLAEAKVTLQ